MVVQDLCSPRFPSSVASSRGVESFGSLPVDVITKIIPCKLHVPTLKGCSVEVASGTGYPGHDWHNTEMSAVYAKVVIEVVHANCVNVKLDYSTPDTEINRLGDLKHQFILWLRRDIILDILTPPA